MAKRQTKDSEPSDADSIKVSRAQISAGVPDEVKIAIADALMEFAAMEAVLEVLIWEITGLSFDDGRLLTKQDIGIKIKLAKQLSEKHKIASQQVKKGTVTMWRAMEELLPARNLIAHGIWVMIDLKTPAAASYRVPSGLDQMSAEAFPISRLEAVARQSKRIRESLDQMIVAANTSRATLASQHQKMSPIPTPIPRPPRK